MTESPDNSPEVESQPPHTDAEVTEAKRGLVRDIALYTLFRLLLVVVITAALFGVGRIFTDEVPIVIVVLFAIIIALPLSMLLGGTLRRRIARNVGIVDAQRKHRRADFRRRLQGVDE